MPYASDQLVAQANKVLSNGSHAAKHAFLTTTAV